MKRMIMPTLMGFLLVTGSVMAADTPPPKAAATAKVAVVNANTKTIDEKGRFHAVHAKKQKLECSDCHGGGADDILFLRTGEFQGKDGPVNREECLTCHQTPKKPAWYGSAK